MKVLLSREEGTSPHCLYKAGGECQEHNSKDVWGGTNMQHKVVWLED